MKKQLQYLFFLVITLLTGCTKTVYVSTDSGASNSIAKFGAIPNDAKDDTDAIIRALKGKDRTINLPAGTFLISKSITIPNDFIIVGSSNTILKATKKIDNIFNLRGDYSIQNVHIENIIFDGNKKAINCLLFYKASFNSPSTLENCRFKNAVESGAVFKACQTSSYHNLRASKNGKHGFEFLGCNALRIFSLSTVHNKKDGLYISRFKEVLSGKNINFSGGLEIFSLHSEHNDGNGCTVNDLQTMVIVFGGWVEGNLRDGFSIKSSSVFLTGVRMSPRPLKTLKGCYSVHVFKSRISSDVSVNNCFINSGANNWHDVVDENNSKNTVVKDLHRFNGLIVARSQKEMLDKELVSFNAMKSWKPWYKSQSKSSGRRTPDGYDAVQVIPNMRNGGASSVVHTKTGDIIKVEFYLNAKSGTKMSLLINPSGIKPTSEGEILSENFTAKGGWEQKIFFYLSEGTENNIWVRNTDSNQANFDLGKLSAKKVLTFEKRATEFYGNMNPIYKEIIPSNILHN